MTPESTDTDTRLPVGLLTGFLGGGKTTLLQRWLHGGAPGETAVLINEFGDVGLDHLLVGSIDADTVLLENGCVCCSMRDELKDALLDMYSRRQRGELPAFRRIIIETTGLATPGPVLATLLGDIQLRMHFQLAFVATVVDATRAFWQQAHHAEWLTQVAAADTLWLSKADLTDESEMQRVQERLQQLNPMAAQYTTDMDAAGWLDEVCQRPVSDDMQAWMQRVRAGTLLPMRPAGRFGGTQQARGTQTNTQPPAPETQASAFCLSFDEPLNWFTLTIWLTSLIHCHGASILRIKGLLWVYTEDRSRPQVTVLHGLGHLMHPPAHLDAWPDPQESRSRLVFITQGLTEDEVTASWQAFTRFYDAV
ncbi:MAG: GTP-binding protein [Lautropia sp.]|nr:GTP-binding protein [Lautropia sp.]